MKLNGPKHAYPMAALLVRSLVMLCAFMLQGKALDKATVTKLKASTVFIDVENESWLSGKKSRVTGTGFFISANGYVVSNYHVIRPALKFRNLYYPLKRNRIRIFENSGQVNEKIHTARVIAIDREHDLAILQSTAKGVSFLELGESTDIYETIPIWVAGFPLGNKFSILNKGPAITFNSGSITSLRRDERGKLLHIQTDAKFTYGSSGSPLIDSNGKLIAIAQAIIAEDKKVHMTIPVNFLAQLMSTVDLKNKSAAFKIAVNQKFAATTFINTENLKDAAYPTGPYQISICGKNSTRIKLTHLKENFSLEESPPKINTMKINYVDKNKSTAKIPAEGKILYQSNYADQGEIKKMQQDTGGKKSRSWTIHNNALQQHKISTVLRAIYFGNSAWTNYSISAEAKITQLNYSSRIGIIFRENDTGFYLFRIHHTSQKAQLVYHQKQPFGWFILAETKLENKISEDYMKLKVYNFSDSIICMLGTKTIFNIKDNLSSKGRAGFYSGDCKASFKNTEVKAIKSETNTHASAVKLRGFWVTDTFNAHSQGWSFANEKSEIIRPFLFTNYGAVNLDNSKTVRVALINNYQLADFTMHLLCALENNKPGSSFGLVFASQGETDYRISITKNGKLVLIKRTKDKRTVIKKIAIR
ncbi:MAG: trypsin-like peptidase domain-containing protein, partial [Lentisphaeria bacterium]|nr:trypsin-like peptidase domain-containing protein [Lentisphaeria bacterium]